MSPDEEIKKLRNDVKALQEAIRNRRPDPVLLAPFLQLMVVTTTIPAATGTTTLTVGTSGRARPAKYDGTAHTLTADTAQPIETVLNEHNKTFTTGAFIKVCSLFGQLWVFDVHDCAKFV